MFTNYNEAAQNLEIKNALDSMGLNTKLKETQYFSDIVLDLCYCMSVNNKEVQIRSKKDNIRLIQRMDKVGECLNSPLMDKDQRKIVDDYIGSCRLECANFVYEIGLTRFNNAVASCASKINKHLEPNDVLIMFARNVYAPMPVIKEKGVSKVKKIEK